MFEGSGVGDEDEGSEIDVYYFVIPLSLPLFLPDPLVLSEVEV